MAELFGLENSVDNVQNMKLPHTTATDFENSELFENYWESINKQYLSDRLNKVEGV